MTVLPLRGKINRLFVTTSRNSHTYYAKNRKLNKLFGGVCRWFCQNETLSKKKV